MFVREMGGDGRAGHTMSVIPLPLAARFAAAGPSRTVPRGRGVAPGAGGGAPSDYAGGAGRPRHRVAGTPVVAAECPDAGVAEPSSGPGAAALQARGALVGPALAHVCVADATPGACRAGAGDSGAGGAGDGEHRGRQSSGARVLWTAAGRLVAPG